MAQADVKLTTVKLLTSLYKRFKKNSLDTGINLQKLTNRSMHMYNNDLQFRNRLDDYFELQMSGSNF